MKIRKTISITLSLAAMKALPIALHNTKVRLSQNRSLLFNDKESYTYTNPRMSQGLSCSNAFCWINSQHTVNKIFSLNSDCVPFRRWILKSYVTKADKAHQKNKTLTKTVDKVLIHTTDETFHGFAKQFKDS